MNLANTGIAFITCLLLGAGIGLLLGNLEAGGAIGLGAGLIFVAVFRKK
ncbi:hypothetical protein [Virgibacillus sp. YIM 98842]|jgi:ABC-type arginine transport system permease subunit|nr:hypothetical protein [Virgibacillus sp. YIM 98842]